MHTDAGMHTLEKTWQRFHAFTLRMFPQVSQVPVICGVPLTADDVLCFVRQIDRASGASVKPPAVDRILHSKSCRGAVMFGDALSVPYCQQLLQQLSRTTLCFQCAHGRPTVIPCLDTSGTRAQSLDARRPSPMLGRLHMVCGAAGGSI